MKLQALSSRGWLPRTRVVFAWAAASFTVAATAGPGRAADGPFGDYRTQKPGRAHKITPADMPPPHATKAVDNRAEVVPRPKDAWPEAPEGFQVTLYADGLAKPRLARTAPNGDVFVAESRSDRVKVLRGIGEDGKAQQIGVFASGLKQPFGIAFYPPKGEPTHVYIANTDAVVRFPYKSGDLEARGPAETLAKLPGGGLLRGGGHWTRDIAFSLDGKRMFVSVGSKSNNDDVDNNPDEERR
ncbi:MAG TPA: sorbosone dehydrogenase family protein, partial [Polyangia bacterium]